MKLSLDILYTNLKDVFDMEIKGAKPPALAIRHVDFFRHEETLREDSVYIVSGDALGEYKKRFNGISFICVGGAPRWSDTHTKSMLLIIHDAVNSVDVFHEVQEVFFRYEAWEDKLLGILDTTSSLLEMVDVSIPIFGNPIQISDHQWNLLAYTKVQVDEKGTISEYSVERLKANYTSETLKILEKDHPKDKRIKKPYFYRDSRYCINLFVHNRFVCNMQLVPFVRPLAPGDLLLFEYLSTLVSEALHQHTAVMSNQVHTRKTLLMDIMNSKHIDPKWTHQLTRSSLESSERCVCFKLLRRGGNDFLPSAAICQSLEYFLPGCVAFEYQSSTAAFLSLEDCPYGYEDSLKILDGFLADMDFQAGISDMFDDVLNARHYFMQAECALEAGGEADPDQRYYLFEDYALSYLLKHCTGNIQPEFMCPRGLIRLRERDDAASSDYWNILHAYLANGMNGSQTANQLFLHRSTLMQKLARIQRILGVDLQDPRKRLYVQMCMNLMDMRAKE